MYFKGEEKKTRFRTLRGLFKERRRWTQGEWVKRKRNGQYAFCLLGGLDECYGEDTTARVRAYDKIVAAMYSEGYFSNPMTFNDYNRFEVVRRIVNKARV